MKKLLYLFLVLGLVMLTAGCTHTSREPRLVAVDSMLATRPDSALALLRQDLLSSFGEAEASSEADRMYYYLLLADACNKCYDTLPSDSIMHLVADFYDTHGTPNEQVRAHYLLGCVYRDLGEAPQALDCYHTALDRADTTASDCNYRLLMSVYGQMADLFHKQNLPQDEIWALEKSGQCDLIRGDTIGYIQSIELTARAHFILGDTARVIETLNKSKQLYLRYKENNLAYSANGTLAYILLSRGKTDKARVLLDEYEHHFTQDSCRGTIARGQEMFYGIKSAYYLQVHKLDSAVFYARKLIPFNYKADAYRALLTIFEQRKNTDSIVKYARLYEDAVDTLNNRKRTEVVGQISSMYNYQRLLIKAEQEEATASNLRRTLLFVTILSFSVIVTGIYIYRRYQIRKKKEITGLHSQYTQSLSARRKLQQELKSLHEDKQHYVREKEQEVFQLEESIKGYQEKLRSLNDIDEAELQNNELVCLFHEKASGKRHSSLPTKREWKKLISLFKRNMPVERVVHCRKGLLSEMELQTYVLLMFGFSDSESAVLQDTSPQSVNNAKSRINKKLFNDSSSASLKENLCYRKPKV